jgi:GDPmannose 4,6-dehydratase
VTRKTTRAVARIRYGFQDILYLGNLDARRDWGYAPDYVMAMWQMLQQDHPSDYVIATGVSHSVREFCEMAFQEAGIELEWQGSGTSEIGIVKSTAFTPMDEEYALPRPGKKVVAVDPNYFRPTEVESLLGDPSKAREELGWEPTVIFDELAKIMVAADIQDLLNLHRSRDVVRKIIDSGTSTLPV